MECRVNNFITELFFEIKTLLNLDLIAQSLYALFYPLAIFGLTRAIRFKAVSKSLELLDTAIIAIGYTTTLTALLVRPAMTTIDGSIFEVFLAILLSSRGCCHIGFSTSISF